MSVFPLLDRRTAIVRCVEQLAGETLFHGVLGPTTRRADQPADRERLAAIRADFNRHLIGGATDAARPNLDRRADIAQRVVEHAQRVLAGPLLDAVERPIDDAFGGRLLARIHQAVDELREDHIAELGVRQDLPLFGGATTRHARSSSSLLCLLRTLRAVLRTALTAVLDTLGIQRAANDMVSYARQIFDATATNHDDRMLLQIMAFARDVARDFEAVGQPHARNLAQRRVRLLRRRRIDPGANTALLRASLQRRHLVACLLRRPGVPDQLVDGRHRLTPHVKQKRQTTRIGIAGMASSHATRR